MCSTPLPNAALSSEGVVTKVADETGTLRAVQLDEEVTNVSTAASAHAVRSIVHTRMLRLRVAGQGGSRVA